MVITEHYITTFMVFKLIIGRIQANIATKVLISDVCRLGKFKQIWVQDGKLKPINIESSSLLVPKFARIRSA